ncbi:MAG: hypothetical protein P4L92_12235 [Rudaea sp.]|nr:hypothetical protein [Rudaea sp.]
MWKLLRNLALAGILLAGVLKLLAWYEVGQDAQRITAALAPYAQVHYDSISAGLDGSVNLSGVNVAVKRDKTQDVFHADSVAVETPGVFWLLKHALFSESLLPPRFGVSVSGLKLPSMPWLDSQWLNPSTLVPFETLGCGVSAFAPADYSKMGVSVGDTRQRVDYRYDMDSKTLDLTLTLASPGFAKLALEAEVHPFDPKGPMALDKLHVDQLSMDYSDLGYLERRNRFCGQRASIGPGQFAEQHVAAVQALLQQHGIQASNELMKLYRHLVESGGQASILSLPNSSFVAGTGLTLAPEDLLRQLNVTARYQDTPPVMFRLSFAAPAQAETVADTPPSTPIAAVTGNLSGTASIPVPVPPSPSMPPVTATIPPSGTAAAAIAHVPAESITAAAKPVAATPPAASPPGRPPGPNMGLDELDRAEARLPQPPRPVSPRSTPDFLPSTPPPPPGSTMALVWKPTIERLGAPPPEYHDYDVIEYARLKDAQGRRVRLITEGGKKVEGYVIGADDTGVELRVNGGGGDAQFVVPKMRIQQVQLLRRYLPSG